MSTANTSSNKATESWLDWFVGRESSEVNNKLNQEKLFETFNVTVSKIDCIKAMVQYHETAHLQQESFGVRKINIFHHLIKVGDNLYNRNEKEFGFIQGFGSSTAVIMSPDIKTLCKTPRGAAVPVLKNYTHFEYNNSGTSR